MTISFDNGKFVARSIFDENQQLKGAGFIWNPVMKRWITEDYRIAEKLLQKCDESAIFQIKFLKEDMQKSVLQSASSEGSGKFPIYHPKNINPFPYQVAGVEYILPRNGVILADEMGLGKGLVVNTLAITPYGKKKFGDLQVGDKIIGSNGKSCNIIGVYPQGMKDIYKITFNDGYSINTDGSHLWTLSSRNSGENSKSRKNRYVTLSTEQLLDENLILEQKGIDWNEKRTYKFKTFYKEKNGNYKWQIPIVKPIEFENDFILPIEPYLLGVALGDGYFNKSSAICIELHKKDFNEIFEGILFTEHKCKNDKRRAYINYHSNDIKNLGLAHCKSNTVFIPTIYKYSSIKNRLAILQGLMDTDGHCLKSKKGVFVGTEYCTTSEKLADDIAEIVHSLGGIVRKSYKIGKYKKEDGSVIECKKAFKLNIKLPNGINPFRIKRKSSIYNSPKKYKVGRYIKNIEPFGKDNTICIKVDATDQLYVVEHGIVTHNTGQALLTMNMRHPVEALIVCPSILKYNWLKEARKWMIGKITAYVYESKKIRYYEGRITNHNKETILHIINYDILEKFRDKLIGTPFNFFVADECFVYDTIVDTDKGKMKIGDIVEKRLNVNLLSYNHQKGISEYKNISRYIKHEKQSKKLLRIELSNGENLICTEEHKIYTIKQEPLGLVTGYCKAVEIKPYDILFLNNYIENIDKHNCLDISNGIEFIKEINNEKSSYFIPESSLEIENSIQLKEEFKNVIVKEIHSLEQSNINLYDIEVENNHNYFANGILVSNCHYIKNMDSKRSKISVELAKKAKWKIFITGTPIYNKPKDLFVALNIIDQNMFGNFYKFASRYCGATKVTINNKNIIKYKGATNVEELNTILRSNYMVRRMKKDVLKDLPEKIKDVIILNESDLDVLVEKEKKAVKESKDAEEKLKAEAEELKILANQDKKYEELYKSKVKSLREIKFKNFGELSRIRKEIAIKKVPYVIDFVKETLENNEDYQSKIVVFGHHKEVLNTIFKELKKYNPVIITGDTSDSERQKSIMLFKEKNEHRVFVGSMGAAGTGVDGLQQNCNTIVFAELDWTPALVDQAESRLQRIGQKNTVWVYHIVANESIDSRIIKLMMEKEKISKDILDYRPEQLYEEMKNKL